MYNIYSPLEQFNIISIIPINIGSVYLSLTNSSLFMAVPTGLLVLLILMVMRRGGFLVPSRWQSVVEMFYEFVVNLVEEQIGSAGRKFFTLVFTSFTFVLALNLIGLIPYSFASTSHLIVTFGLSLSLFMGITIVGFQKHGIHFFSFFLPAGAPLALAPLLVMIELVSYGFRAISLGVRLFANITAGHCLLLILSGFAWTMLWSGGVLAVASIFPFVVVLAITVLEFAVAFLQAYVFAILVCIYLNDVINLH